jgi:hypothetical protein
MDAETSAKCVAWTLPDVLLLPGSINRGVSDQQVHNVSYTRLSKSVSLSENYMVKNK